MLAAIVESSDDAIVSKTLDGVITSWNRSAERLFGYTQDEAIGCPIAMLAPPGREHEMPRILERLRAGERIDHFDTVRRRKDGTLVEISLTISPIRDASGQIVGASKIARDITERRLAERTQRLLAAELDHRVKNTLVVVQSIANRTLTSATTLEAARTALLGRLQALARTHGLLSAGRWQAVPLGDVVAGQLAPFADQIRITGEPVLLNPKAALTFGPALHELATNAVKHGALSTPNGRVEVAWQIKADTPEPRLRLLWREQGGPEVQPSERKGFGTMLIQEGVAYDLGGRARLEFRGDGVVYELDVPLSACVA